MELGLAGRKALICASSKGLGFACATSLAREGVEVVINGRDPERLAAAKADLQARIKRPVSAVAADINTVDGRETLLAACSEADILINNNMGPPPGDFLSFEHDQWIGAIEANMLAALMMIRGVLPGMQARKFGRIVNITSAMVKSPLPHMTLSTAARAGLTAACKGLSRQVIIDNVTINNLLPERFDTDRQKFMAERIMAKHDVDMEEARRRITATLPANRFGKPIEFGDTCAYLCSEQAGFMTGQNVQLDGGAYEGLI